MHPALTLDHMITTEQLSRGWLAVVERGKITQSFPGARVCKLAGKKIIFTIPAKQAIYSCQYTGAVIG